MRGPCGRRRVLLLCESAEAAAAAERALDELRVPTRLHPTTAAACAADDGARVALIVAAAWPPHGELRIAARSPHRTAVVAADPLSEAAIAQLFDRGADDYLYARDDAAVLDALAEILEYES